MQPRTRTTRSKLNWSKINRNAKKVVVETRLVLFGNSQDLETKISLERAHSTGRTVELQARPAFDTGIGQCGKHICSCKSTCVASYSEIEKKFV